MLGDALHVLTSAQQVWHDRDWAIWVFIPLALTGAALFSRLWLIERSNIVTWDEAQ